MSPSKVMQLITVPEDSPARAAFIMDGDYMEPYIRRGEVVTVTWRLPAIGECAVFRLGERTLVRQYCEDSFRNAYLLVLDRAQAALDVTVPPDEALVCVGTVDMEAAPPLPLR